MANKNLKSFQFPGFLQDIYTIPETVIDNTLTQSGQAADSKAVGDEFDNIREIINNNKIIIDNTLTQAGQAADAKETGDRIDGVKSDLEDTLIINLFDPTDPTYIENAYIDGNGNVVTANGYFISNHIPAKAGDTFVATYASQTGLTNIRAYRATGNRIANITGILSDNGKYTTFTIPTSLTSAAYITVNGRTELTEYMILAGDVYPSAYIPHSAIKNDVKLALNSDFKSLKDANDLINNAFGMIYAGEQSVVITNAKTGYFVNATQNRVDASSNFNITDSIQLEKGQTLSFTAKGYSTTTGMICLYNTTSDKYIAVVPSVDSDVREYTYTATEECAVRCSYNKSNTPIAKIITSETTSVIIDNLVDKESNPQIEYPQMFDNVVFVGDSLTYGHDGSKRLTKNYPYFFGKRSVCTVSNQGLTGRTAKNWWDELGATFDFSGFDCAVIYLGTNGGLTDTVETDCNASDYTQNADTSTGCYGKIIGKIKAINPDCKIFLIAGPEEYHSRTTAMNPAVRHLASFYGTGLIDLEECILSDDGSSTSAQRYLYRPVDGIHYDTLGYATFANLVYDEMSNVMQDDLQSYRYT